MLVPQVRPLGALPVSVHTAAPVEQLTTPVWQGSPVGVQVSPAGHVTQLPALQTRPVPHIVPFALFVVSSQTGSPVPHEYVPFLQRFSGWQVAPTVHGPHVPALHTMFVPHVAPFGLSPVTLHIIVPVVHEFAPVLH